MNFFLQNITQYKILLKIKMYIYLYRTLNNKSQKTTNYHIQFMVLFAQEDIPDTGIQSLTCPLHPGSQRPLSSELWWHIVSQFSWTQPAGPSMKDNKISRQCHPRNHLITVQKDICRFTFPKCPLPKTEMQLKSSICIPSFLLRNRIYTTSSEQLGKEKETIMGEGLHVEI